MDTSLATPSETSPAQTPLPAQDTHGSTSVSAAPTTPPAPLPGARTTATCEGILSPFPMAPMLSPPLIATSPPPLIPTPMLPSIGSARRVHFDPNLTVGGAPIANAANGAMAAPSMPSNPLAAQLGLVASPSYAMPVDLLTPPAYAPRPYFTPQPQVPSLQPSLPMMATSALPPRFAGPTQNAYASFMTPQMLPPTMPMHGRRPSPEFGAPFSPSTPAFSSMLDSLTASSLKLKDLSPNDVRSYTTKLERAGLSAWVDNLVYLMENKDPHLRYLLQLPLDQAQHAIDHSLDLQAANAYLARQIDSLLDPTAARVKVFKARQVQDERIARSGILKLAHIRRMCELQNGAEVRHAQKAYDQRCFFKTGMSKDEVAARCYDLSIEFKTLPQFNGDESTMFEVLRKMPDFMHFECDLMYKEVSKGQTLGVAAYTFDQFVECISTAFHHTYEAKGKVKSPGGLQTHGAEVSPKTPRELKCVACGQAGHRSKECTKSCPKCHLKPCPGTVDASKCVVNTRADVPTTVKNALGSNVPEFIRQTLVNKNKAYRDSVGGGGRKDNQKQQQTGRRFAGQRRTNAAVTEDTELEVVETYESPDDDQPFPRETNAMIGGGQRLEGLFSRLTDWIMLFILLALVLTCVLVAKELVVRWRNGARRHRAVDGARVNTASASGAKLSFMLDGGSNSHIINIARESIESLGLETATGYGAISGFAAGSSMPMEGMIQASLCFNTHDRVELVDACYVPNARHNILSESALIDQGIEIIKKPSEQSMMLPGGARIPLTRVNGLYYCDARLERSTGRAVASVQLKLADRALLWAARLGVDAEGLMKISNATQGVGVDHVPKATAEAIDRDAFRRLQCSRKKPVDCATPVRDLANRPGEVFICDGFGKHAAASPVNGAVYQLHAVCEKTSFGYEKAVTSHTIDDWMTFLREVALDARAAGHNPRIFRFDQAPELRSKKLEGRVNKELKMQVELTPRTHHEGVGRVENNNDILTRRAEASLQRAQKGTSWLIPARGYAQHVLNLKPVGNEKESRFQRYYGKVPVVSRERPPYLFGTHVLFHEDKDARGPKGSLHKPRASRGMLVGVTGRRGASSDIAYVVIRSNGNVVTPRHIDPIDELQLLRRGLPSGIATADAECQTPPLSESLTTPVAPRQRADQPTAIDLPIGTRVGVMWKPEKGKAKVEYQGTVIGEVIRPKRARLHKVKYDDHADPLFHDFAHTVRTWRVISKPEASVSPTPTSPMPSNAAKKGRSSPALTRLRAAVQRESNKATQNIIDVKTDLGTAQYRVPANKREVANSPQREEWMEADRKALDAILHAGNVLVPIQKPQDLGIPIARTVTARRIKVDPGTGRLASKNAFKSRHNVDGGYLKYQQEQLAASAGANERATPATSTVVDDLTLKLFLAHATKMDQDLTKGDVGNAYAKGHSVRSLGYMQLPSTLQQLDEDGSPMCIELHTPMWGEREAGYEWQCTFAKTILDMGWVQCEGVPAMYTYSKTGGTSAQMITIVDDFLIKEHGRSVSHATLRILKEKFKELAVQDEPESFAGYKLVRDRTRRTLTLSMPQKIIEAARAHLPDILDPEVKVDVIKGKRLMNLADGLALDPGARESKKLDSTQKATQSIIGSLKFIERIMPEISLPLHRLSCIMSAPPPEALDVAKGVLRYAYLHKSNGISYGKDEKEQCGEYEHVGIEGRAPSELAAAADATWGDARDLYGVLITYNCGSVAHMTKKIRAIVESSHHSEAVATNKAAEQVVYAREVLRAMGDAPEECTKITTDHQANMLVANDASSAKKARHFLNQYHMLQRRIQMGDIAVVKMPTSLMPADFLTKWVPKKKVDLSVRYASNSTAFNA